MKTPIALPRLRQWLDLDGDGFLDLYVATSSAGAVGSLIWMRSGGPVVTVHSRTGLAEEGSPDQMMMTSSSPPGGHSSTSMETVISTCWAYRLNRNLYYRNDGARFRELGREFGLSGRMTRWSGFTYYGHHIGAAVGDLDGDADLDIVMAGLAHPRFFDFSAKTEVLPIRATVVLRTFRAIGVFLPVLRVSDFRRLILFPRSATLTMMGYWIWSSALSMTGVRLIFTGGTGTERSLWTPGAQG